MKYFWHAIAVIALVLFATYLWQNWNNGSSGGSASNLPPPNGEAVVREAGTYPSQCPTTPYRCNWNGGGAWCCDE